MAKSKTVVIDELHLTVRISDGLPEDEVDAVRQTLAEDEFLHRLRRAVRVAFRGFPELSPCRISVLR